jgi:hypothetical protein
VLAHPSIVPGYVRHLLALQEVASEHEKLGIRIPARPVVEQPGNAKRDAVRRALFLPLDLFPSALIVIQW